MYIIPTQSIKRDGKYLTPGTVVEVQDSVGDRLVQRGLATAYFAPNTGLSTDTSSEVPVQKPSQEQQDAHDSELLEVTGVTKALVPGINSVGIFTIEQLQQSTLEKLLSVKGIGQALATKILVSAREDFEMVEE